MPFQDSPQGSPPLAVHFVSWPGEFRAPYITLRAEAENQRATSKVRLKYMAYLSVNRILIMIKINCIFWLTKGNCWTNCYEWCIYKDTSTSMVESSMCLNQAVKKWNILYYHRNNSLFNVSLSSRSTLISLFRCGPPPLPCPFQAAERKSSGVMLSRKKQVSQSRMNEGNNANIQQYNKSTDKTTMHTIRKHNKNPRELPLTDLSLDRQETFQFYASKSLDNIFRWRK